MAPLILTSALDGEEWSTSHPDRFTSRKEPWYPLNRRLSGPQGRFGRFGEEKIILHLLGFETRTVQPVVYSL